MIAELERTAAGPIEEAELRRQLRTGPWCWPHESDERRMRWAQMIARAPIPAMTPGSAIGITLFGRTTCVWRLDLEPAGRPDEDEGHLAELGITARRAWESAAMALPRALPVLWTSVSRAAAHPPRLVHIASADRRAYERVVAIDGPSFGLSFVMILASRVLNVALPEDIAASGAVLPDGAAGEVRGIEEKIDGLLQLAPRVKRLLVAAGQHEEARRHTEARCQDVPFEIIPVKSAAEALKFAFGDRLAQSLVETADPAQRAEIIASLFRLAFAGRATAIDWTPIEAAAGLALNWDALNDDERYQLEFAQAVAARHERNAGELPIPAAGWLDRQPRPIQVGVATHMLQQSADTGVPDPATAERIAKPFLPADERSAYQSQLRLLGTLARLWAVTGRPREALDLQERLARAFFDAFEYGDMSFQFSEWFRLSGALEDRAAFERAEELYQRVLRLGAFGPGGSAFVDLARARAMVMLGVNTLDAAATLEPLAESASVPQHVRWSAARCLIRAHLDAGAVERAADIFARLERASGADRGGAAAKRAALAALDRCVREGRDCLPLIERLRAIERGVIANLLSSAPSGEQAAYIARFYPY